MFNKIRKHFERVRKRKLAIQWSRGWDYAAGYLLQHGEEGIDYLQHWIEQAKAFNQYTAFDRGIESALIKYACYTTFPHENH